MQTCFEGQFAITPSSCLCKILYIPFVLEEMHPKFKPLVSEKSARRFEICGLKIGTCACSLQYEQLGKTGFFLNEFIGGVSLGKYNGN